MSDFGGSYIDDSFGARPWPEPPQPIASSGDDLYGFNCPREGHWEVESTIGSFVDDRCPTARGYPTHSSGEGNVTRLDAGLLQHLARATTADKLANIKATAEHQTNRPSSLWSSVTSQCAEVKDERKRPFVVPARLARNPDLTAGRQSVIAPEIEQQPGFGIAAEAALFLRPSSEVQLRTDPREPSLHASGSNAGARKIRILGKNGEQAFVELPTMAAGSPNALQQAKSSTHDAKDKPKPSTKLIQRPTKQEKKEAKKDRTDMPKEALQGEKNVTQEGKKTTKQQQRKQKPKSDNQKEQVEAPMDFLMSGGLGAPSSKASAQAKSVHSASNDSTHSRASHAESAISQKVLSIAQKIASMPPSSGSPSKVPSIRDPAPVPSQTGWIEVGHGTTRPTFGSDEGSRHTKRSVNYKPPSVHSAKSSSSVIHGFGDSAFNMFDQPQATSGAGSHAPSDRPPSELQHTTSVAVSPQAARFGGSARGSQAVRATPSGSRLPSHVSQHKSPEAQVKSSSSIQHSFHAASGFRLAEPTPPASVRGETRVSQTGGSDNARPPSRRSGQGSANGQQPTKFAGTGWISPHPLSVVPTEMASPPQSVVHLPGESFDDPGATLTYDQWKAQRANAPTVVSVQPAYSITRLPLSPDIASIEHDPAIPAYHDQSVHEASHHSRQMSCHAEQGWVGSASVHASHRSVFHRSAEQNQPSHHSHPKTADVDDGHFSQTSQRPFVLVQDAGWSFPTQVDGSRSDLARTSYNVGLTPNELDEYNKRLGDTISHHSAQLSHVQQEQQASHPDYSSWNSRNNRSPRPSSQQSSMAARSLSGSQPMHLPMPWETPADDIESHSAHSLHSIIRSPDHSAQYVSEHASPPHSQSAHCSQLAPPVHVPGPTTSRHASVASTIRLASQVSSGQQASPQGSECMGSHLRQDRAFSAESNGSASLAPPPQSEATYGTRNWQDLEDAEQGRGGFQSYRMW